MTSDTPDAPPFHLPDWGTEGAPPPPEAGDLDADDHVPDDPDDQRPVVNVEVDTSVMFLTTPLPAGWTVTNVIGLVTATASSSKGSPKKALQAASQKALEALEGVARKQRADGVVGLRLSVESDDDGATVLAYGTAVDFTRD